MACVVSSFSVVWFPDKFISAFFVFVFPRSCAQIVIGSSNNDGQDQFNKVSHTFSKADLLRTLQRSSYHARCLCIQSHTSLNLSVDHDVLLPLGFPSHQWSWFLVAKSEENKKNTITNASNSMACPEQFQKSQSKSQCALHTENQPYAPEICLVSFINASIEFTLWLVKSEFPVA